MLDDLSREEKCLKGIPCNFNRFILLRSIDKLCLVNVGLSQMTMADTIAKVDGEPGGSPD